MRVLVVVAHYFKSADDARWSGALGSARAPLAKAVALNAQIVALHRYFGPRRGSINSGDAQGRNGGGDNVLDIVVMTARDANLLQRIDLDPSTYTVEYVEGDPLMLPFAARRIMRERAGGYDVYAYMEDDLIVDDPAFFAKISWFAGEFGSRAMLLPVRYEMASTGTPARMSISPRLSRDKHARVQRAGCPPLLTGRWNGSEQTFYVPNNPHAGCHVLTDAQLKLWMDEPSFSSRDASWIDPLVSAATHAPSQSFCLYLPAEPDPWFLSIEHFGIRYAATAAPAGMVYGEPLLLKLAEQATMSDSTAPLSRLSTPATTLNALTAEAAQLRLELNSLRRSRSRLAKALLAAFWHKLTR